MSRYEYDYTSTFERAGFCLPFSGAKVYPDQEAFIDMSRSYDYIPLFACKHLNNFNIIGFVESIQTETPSCLLESLTGSDNGRYSIVAHNALHTISTAINTPEGIKPLDHFISSLHVPSLEFPFFTGGLIGYWSYETGLYYQGLAIHPGAFEEQFFFMPGEILVYDRHENELWVFTWIKSNEACAAAYQKACRNMDSRLSAAADYKIDCRLSHPKDTRNTVRTNTIDQEFTVNVSREAFCSMVKEAKEHIRQGDIFQVVLSQRWHKESKADPWRVYCQLRDLNPSPYMFYFTLPAFTMMGASPEMQVKVQADRLKSRPIAGTRKVTGDKVLDGLLGEELLEDEKERAEHLMLVDLSRNDVGRVCQAGTVELTEFMQLEKYSHVMHLVSTVEGELKPEISSLEAFQSCFPAGTLSGAPKRKAMEIIQRLENSPRGPYGGSAGYIAFNGQLDSCISIRAIKYQNGKYYLQSGAGIVADSDPEMEYKETLNKARALMVAIKEAEGSK